MEIWKYRLLIANRVEKIPFSKLYYNKALFIIQKFSLLIRESDNHRDWRSGLLSLRSLLRLYVDKYERQIPGVDTGPFFVNKIREK